MRTSKLVTGVLAGFAVGTILGILYAPEKGSEMRKKISEKKRDYVDQLKTKSTALANSLKKEYTTENASFSEDGIDPYPSKKKNKSNQGVV